MTRPVGYPLASGRLESRFVEKNPPYPDGEAQVEAARCLYCFGAPRVDACPTAIDIPTFIRKISTGNLRGSARTILSANLLGASCARVCPVEVLCEGSCVYVAWGRRPVSIGRLQRFAMDHGASPELLPLPGKRTGFSVGLIGAGPASLACAGTLVLAGHRAVIYERGSLPGGLNTTGVAPYKMAAAGALEEVAFVEGLGVEIETGIEVGNEVSAEELLDRHDALFLGPGLGDDSSLGVPGEEGPGVVGAVEWIRLMKTDPAHEVTGVDRAVVVGGGNTALDAARELAQLGVPEVRLVYRRSESKMPGYRHEWRQAREEGVSLLANAIVQKIGRVNGAVSRIELVRARDGRPTDEALDPLSADLVVVAIGQAKLRDLVDLFPGVVVDARGRIVVDPATGVTGNPRIFAGGDAANGGKEVVNAVDEGQRAARALDAWLRRDRSVPDA